MTCWPSPPWPIAMRPARRPLRAQAQVDACTECATLHAELVSLATSARQLPAIERPRDFRLRPEDAQRLRPNRFRRLFGSFGTARDGFSRPLAMGLTTLGHRRADARDPARHAVDRWRRERPEPARGRIGSAAGGPDVRRCRAVGARACRGRCPGGAAGREHTRERERRASTAATARSQHPHQPEKGSTSATTPTTGPWISPASRSH